MHPLKRPLGCRPSAVPPDDLVREVLSIERGIERDFHVMARRRIEMHHERAAVDELCKTERRTAHHVLDKLGHRVPPILEGQLSRSELERFALEERWIHVNQMDRRLDGVDEQRAIAELDARRTLHGSLLRGFFRALSARSVGGFDVRLFGRHRCIGRARFDFYPRPSIVLGLQELEARCARVTCNALAKDGLFVAALGDNLGRAKGGVHDSPTVAHGGLPFSRLTGASHRFYHLSRFGPEPRLNRGDLRRVRDPSETRRLVRASLFCHHPSFR